MGRFLAALKRLEPEMSVMRGMEPAASSESSATVEPSITQVNVLKPSVELQEDLPAMQDGPENGSVFQDVVSELIPVEQSFDYSTHEENNISRPVKMPDGVAAEPETIEQRPFVEVSAKLDNLERLFEEELPLQEEADAITPHRMPSEELQGKRDQGVFDVMARNILAQLPGNQAMALFFTSPTDSEGKTETILPLAEALIEESGQRAILLDANLHHPDLTQEWRFTSRRGIFDVLTGEADWWEAVQETGLPKLSILVNNGLPTHHAVFAQPLAFSELLENLKREYRLVLIDAASLAHAESVSMVRYCQGAYLVVRLGHASHRTVREARQVIDQAGGRLLGCIAVADVMKPAKA